MSVNLAGASMYIERSEPARLSFVQNICAHMAAQSVSV